MAKNNNTELKTLGVAANIVREDNSVLEQNVVFSLLKDEKISAELVVGLFDESKSGGVISLTIESITDDKIKPNTIQYGVNRKTGACIIQLCNWFDSNNTANTSNIVINKKIAEYYGRNIILEMIISYANNRRDTLVINLNIYSKNI